MLYFYDKNNLEYKFAKKSFIIIILAIIYIFLSIFIIIGSFFDDENKTVGTNSDFINISELESEERIIVINDTDKFSEEKLKDYILEINIKFPDIVFAQARYESGNWGTNPGADLFKKNNNLFGMKEATSRTTTNHGTQFGHAFYDHWRLSVIDYAMWQDAYARDLKTRDEYISYLKRVYAEGTYASIMQIIKEVRKKYPELCTKTYPKLENKKTFEL